MAKLISRLSKIANQAPASAREALVETAEAIVDLTKQLTPVDTGMLRDSYEAGEPTDKSILVGTSVEYAKFVEYGTSDSAAQPHLTPAFAQTEETFKAILKRKVSELK